MKFVTTNTVLQKIDNAPKNHKNITNSCLLVKDFYLPCVEKVNIEVVLICLNKSYDDRGGMCCFETICQDKFAVNVEFSAGKNTVGNNKEEESQKAYVFLL